VSTGNRAAHGFFAAREFCLDLWPEATRRVFPSEHVIDLGATAFERMLRAHLDAREIVSTMQTAAQRVVLGIAAAHFATAPDRPIIEIGSAFGGSALLMAAATTEASPGIVSIDPDAPTRDIMRFAFERNGHGQRLQQIVKTSDSAIADLRHLTRTCGLVFVDGLHTADAVARDFYAYAPLVAAGGALLFHDVCPALHPVMQAVIEHVLPDRRFKAKCLVDGLLVLECVG
jgi:predicted O-methyltransferase YrrM